MSLLETMNGYFDKIAELGEGRGDAFCGECVFFDKDEILDYGKAFGNSRYPYSRDGLTLWANSSGYMTAEESTLVIFPDATEGREPRLAFFLGKECEGGFLPISITGVAAQMTEGDVRRYTVFTPYATYYLTECEGVRACVRAFLDKEKRIHFTALVSNETGDEVKSYFSSYFNFHLKTNISEAEAKWYKKTEQNDGGFFVSVTEHINRNVCFERYAQLSRSESSFPVESTTSHCDYCGGYNNQLSCAKALGCGSFSMKKPHTVFNETSIAADMVPLTLAAGESFEIGYTLAIGTTPCEVIERANAASSLELADKMLEEMKSSPDEIYKKIPTVSFSSVNGVEGGVLGNFINNVLKQAEFCARAKNYAGPFIGIRDIFQQLEASLMWIPEYTRTKITEALNFIGEDGRAPRQYSYPQSADVPPEMDIRPFIDQGNWIITTVYEYLAFSGDYSILSESCGYYKIGKSGVDFSERRDDVLEHLIAIVDYLLSHVDSETNCLHALYGDWNDALDGLGRTKRSDDEYGNGVSVMATLHLYRNLYEITEILRKSGRRTELIERYLGQQRRIGEGIIKNAVVEKNGERKIIHGWGEDKSYQIGSFLDNDGESRDSLTSNAFFILSGAIALDPSLKADIMAALGRLDSKYGYKTFNPYFAKTNLDVGRIVKLPRGTAENGATYIHATLFAIWALYKIGEGRAAWEQILKILPITHDFISTSPFVMPNSYIHNDEELLDGESMSDWFTGSGCVLAKVLVRMIFGIEPTLDGITVAPAAYMPATECSIALELCGAKISLTYRNVGRGERRFTVNGIEQASEFDEALGTKKINLLGGMDYDILVED